MAEPAAEVAIPELLQPADSPREHHFYFTDGDKVASIHSRFRVNLVLTNRTKSEVEVLWVDFEGYECSYGFIEPEESILLYTYLTHPWVFRSKEHAIGDLVVDGSPVCWPSPSHKLKDVMEAPWRAWDPASHVVHFKPKFPQFAAEVRQLLLAYNAQHKRPGSCRSSAGGDDSAVGGRKSRRSSSTGGSEPEFGCCGELWTNPCQQDVADYKPSSLPVPEPQGHGSLGSLPYDLVLKIISHLAPPLRMELPVVKESVDMLPPGLGQGTAQAVVHTAALLLGPRPPPPPVAGDADAWFAAAHLVQRAGGGPAGMQQLPPAAPAGPLAAGVAIAGATALLIGAAQLGQHAVVAQAVAAAAKPAVPLPASTHEVLQYVEALALANAAITRRERMALQQDQEATALWRYVQARKAARERCAKDREALQQPSVVAARSHERQVRLAPWPLQPGMFDPIGVQWHEQLAHELEQVELQEQEDLDEVQDE
ncbi:hypothetical protein HYH02_005133 [Chlamydomonas schloesseri]|uniref:von Hippel-Lindau disease tumour suppressor beta domain-containing protein n=1 Tax=Chlamydomonas schloesseri TaxID=2026947 RepID=A0A836B7A3_9CHLO|nr:hypothetical protein HYH02_005133 [Chlamydomonas schloesseri]|eukprot:KAG2449600.1 hypothetical protein HYH02_005133 [Chlamydomonas schloesseri]